VAQRFAQPAIIAFYVTACIVEFAVTALSVLFFLFLGSYSGNPGLQLIGTIPLATNIICIFFQIRALRPWSSRENMYRRQAWLTVFVLLVIMLVVDGTMYLVIASMRL